MTEQASPPSPESSGAQEALERAVKRALDESSAAEPGEDIVRQVLLEERYRGAFAHPEILRQLNDVIENGAERAFSVTEKEQAHRHLCERDAITAEIDALRRDQQDRRIVIYGTFAYLFVSLAIAAVLVLGGYSAAAIGLAASGILVALIGMFHHGRSGNKAS